MTEHEERAEQLAVTRFESELTDNARQAGDATAKFLEFGAQLVVVTAQNRTGADGSERLRWNLVARWPSDYPAPGEWDTLSHDEQLAKFGIPRQGSRS